MNKDDFSKKNYKNQLNLLVAFDAVYHTGSVKLAASLLNCSPSNISQSLQRLRVLFDDPLFVRDGQKISSTTFAEQLYAETKDSLHELQYVISNLGKTNKTKLIIESTPYFSMKYVPLVTEFLNQKNIECEIVSINHFATRSMFSDRLSLKKVDIALGMKSDMGHSREHFHIGRDKSVLVCSKNHPRLKDSYNHGVDAPEKVALLFSDTPEVMKMRALNPNFYEDTMNSLVAKSIFTISSHLSVSCSLAMMPEWYFNKFQNVFNLKSLTSNLELPVIEECMYFNKSSINKALYQEIYEYLKQHYNEC